MIQLDVNLDGYSEPSDLDRLAEGFGRLAAYARHKAQAMRERSAGRLPMARLCERRCDTLYKEMPDWAKW